MRLAGVDPARIVSSAGPEPVDRGKVRERRHMPLASLAATDSLWPELLERLTTANRTDRDVRLVNNTPYADVWSDCKLAIVVAAPRGACPKPPGGDPRVEAP